MPAKVSRLLAAYVLCGHVLSAEESRFPLTFVFTARACTRGCATGCFRSRRVRLLLADVKVFVDPKAVMYLVGSVMDFVEDAVRAEFVFQNPNAKGACGCGESFNV